MAKFLPLFIERYNQNDKKFLNVNSISIKQLLKFMLDFFNNKYAAAKDSLIVKHQFIGEFIYD